MSIYFKTKVCLVVMFCILLANTVYSNDKSLYVVRMRNNEFNLIAFEIDGNQLNYQAKAVIPEHG